MNARGLVLLGWAGMVGVAESAPETPAAVQVETAPEIPPVIPDLLPPDPPTTDTAERIDRFVLNGPRFLKDVTRIPLAELRQLAPLRNEAVKKAANLHDPLKIDEFRTFTFDGLEIYGFMGDQGELWPIRITVSAPAWEVAEDLGIGSDSARVIELLGEPTIRNPEAWQYQGAIQNVNFFMQKGKIAKIEFIYYLD